VSLEYGFDAGEFYGEVLGGSGEVGGEAGYADVLFGVAAGGEGASFAELGELEG
jgi:hypothetical protein